MKKAYIKPWLGLGLLISSSYVTTKALKRIYDHIWRKIDNFDSPENQNACGQSIHKVRLQLSA
jgi:hypothetical protein